MLRRPRKSKKKSSADVIDHSLDVALGLTGDRLLGNELEPAVQFFDRLLGMINDFVMRRFHVFGSYPAVMCYFANMVDQALINKDILKPFMYVPPHLEDKTFELGQLTEVLLNDTIYHSACKLERKLEALVHAVLQGNTIVIIDGLEDAFLIDTRNIDKRSIDTPATEQVNATVIFCHKNGAKKIKKVKDRIQEASNKGTRDECPFFILLDNERKHPNDFTSYEEAERFLQGLKDDDMKEWIAFEQYLRKRLKFKNE